MKKQIETSNKLPKYDVLGGTRKKYAARYVPLMSLEICAGAGGQALGIEQAGFHPLALVENDRNACATLRINRPQWNVIEQDVCHFSAADYRGVDLFAAGVPCPPFSVAGKQIGAGDERDLFPQALRLIAECQPRAVMLENVRGLLDPAFADYRGWIDERLRCLDYVPRWKLLNACDFGVPQLRPRVVCVALAEKFAPYFAWPESSLVPALTVGAALRELMASGGWENAEEWAAQANRIAPTLVGGSKKHGGPDLGPTRARAAWAALGVDGGKLALGPPPPGFAGMPNLTVPMAARIQGFPSDWKFSGSKTAAYRQVGNAFPPPVARAVAAAIHCALNASEKKRKDGV